MAAITIRNRHIGWRRPKALRTNNGVFASSSARTEAPDVARMKSSRAERKLNRAQSLADQLSD